MKWARHRQPRPIGKGHERADLLHLFIISGLVDRLHRTERHPRRVQERPPVLQVSLDEDRIEDLHQRASVLLARRARSKARVIGEVWLADRGHEIAPLPWLI